ncbi:hypothetical protein LTR96_010923 [Exophiala xenobiotica]|nr:hypothetical protein LTR41_010987 [Exophiala xenobiotica]KAK5215296.1 hypothetical protein LTR72_011641 [Exophiala xenobiotica]KAK5218846.1 hypothetical protein LTR47_011645 [Exophiala xenobiotica]KAK5243348.1 hypothetical protein LTS06_010875 [Exophiala xenobiotica]KAK5263719.1 hypothetical protein LTR96_010923 [Exophiala xenobiotica]
MVRRRTLQAARSLNHDTLQPGGDLEPGYMRRIPRFKDVVDVVLAQRHKQDLSKRLQEGVDTGAFERYRKSDEELKEIKKKKVREFYSDQNSKLDDWREVDTIVRAVANDVMDSMDPDPDNDAHRERGGQLQHVQERVGELLPDELQTARRIAKRNVKRAININVVANVLLVVAKAIATLKSSSLSLIASLLDSTLDLLCTAIIWITNKLVSWKLLALRRRFPTGRRRLEPLGILVFSVLMVISFFQVLQESVTRLLPNSDHKIATLSTTAIAAIATNVGLKGIIGLAYMRMKSTQVQALVQDCKTDVYFNTLSLIFPLIGKHTHIWWLDPAGAALLSLYIIYDWAATGFDNTIRLCGSSCDNRLQKKLTYLAYRFSPLVAGFKSITAYHMGDGIWVEFDLLLDEQTSLRDTHDISQTLQYCCEALPEVDRAFVAIDYSAQNPAGHSMDDI